MRVTCLISSSHFNPGDRSHFLTQSLPVESCIGRLFTSHESQFVRTRSHQHLLDRNGFLRIVGIGGEDGATYSRRTRRHPEFLMADQAALRVDGGG
ncbi:MULTISPECIES: hypothetical protein [Burkholderia]|uniref:hypothetical protein n=1 Tax=Burkholderia TaxID=32008 RepID=UPI0012E3C276|nr:MULTISPECIES: hypothetical protein [Burkholderia]